MQKEKTFAFIRILFGFAWAADAWFKWQPGIRNDIVSVLTQAQSGQPGFEQAWINAWVNIANINPHLFGILIAVIETALALSLITGVLSRYALYAGALFVLMIWSVPQGFGGPYGPTTTDIDSGFIYFLLFVSLIVGNAWRRFDLSSLIRRSQ